MGIVLKGATNSAGKILDIFIEDGIIVKSFSSSVEPELIKCDGLVVLPGFVDLHAHLREPGYEQSETIYSGSSSAALGGFTAVQAMANTFPVADTAGVVEQIFRIGEEVGLVEVQPVGAITVGLRGEQLAELGAMAASKAAVKIFSDDGNCLQDPALMRRALEYVKAFGGTIAQHAQEKGLTVGAQMNEGALSANLGLAGWPAVAEESIIARDILLAEHTKSKLHVCHVSTRGSVEIIRQAKKRGVAVTAEVTPHHLLLTEDLVANFNPVYKVNPPLRSESDNIALIEGLVDGTIDAIATDHAPHPHESKDTDWASAAFGMVGFETAYSIAQKILIDSGLSNYQRLAEVLSISPARIAGLAKQGKYLTVGQQANLTLVDPKETWIAESKTQSLSSNNPYAGMQMTGRVRHTIFSGEFTVRDYKVMER